MLLYFGTEVIVDKLQFIVHYVCIYICTDHMKDENKEIYLANEQRIAKPSEPHTNNVPAIEYMPTSRPRNEKLLNFLRCDELLFYVSHGEQMPH